MAVSDRIWPFLKIRAQKKSKFTTKKAKSFKRMHLMHLKWIWGLCTYSESLKPLVFAALSTFSKVGTKNGKNWAFLGRRHFRCYLVTLRTPKLSRAAGRSNQNKKYFGFWFFFLEKLKNASSIDKTSIWTNKKPLTIDLTKQNWTKVNLSNGISCRVRIS